jgi:hypothetical protein
MSEIFAAASPIEPALDKRDPLPRLDDLSDRISPIVVKEVRQFVRGREFIYSFGACLVVAMAVAFYASADALGGSATTGAWSFSTLTACLGLLGLAVVPLGAFSTLRNERLELTLDLISLTTLSSRRIVLGKLLSQVVKLVTLFAVMAPFIAMSFLLGGIDFVTILTALVMVFLWSMWMAAAALFLSTLLKSRAMSGLMFGVLGIFLFVFFNVGRLFFISPVAFALTGGGGVFGSRPWWGVFIVVAACLVTMMNLVLLAENRLALPTEDRVTPLRVGFLVQFLVIVGFALRFVGAAPVTAANTVESLGYLGGLHLALVASFAVTEGLSVPRVPLAQKWSRWPLRALLPILGPGGDRAAAYILVQMAALLAAGWCLGAGGIELRWLLTICGFICAFTGFPALVADHLASRGVRPFHARVAILVLVVLSLVLPDVVYYVLFRPEVFQLSFSHRHLFNPLRTLVNWDRVEASDWQMLPLIFAGAGFLYYVALMLISRTRASVEPSPAPALEAEAPQTPAP